jgi:UDP-glucose 4-epimerase
VSGVDFKVEITGPRAGDPARIVADSRQARAALGWQPRFDDLSTIVAHALAWERELMKRRAAERAPAAVATTGSQRS